MADLRAEEYTTFEGIKRTRADGTEFWFARELAQVLDYAKWENFSKVIDRAILACRNSGFETADHFPEVGKMVEIGSGAKRKQLDYEMGATLPEDLPKPAKSIQAVEREELRKLRKSGKPLMLDE